MKRTPLEYLLVAYRQLSRQLAIHVKLKHGTIEVNSLKGQAANYLKQFAIFGEHIHHIPIQLPKQADNTPTAPLHLADLPQRPIKNGKSRSNS